MVDKDATLYDFMLGSKYEGSDQPWFVDALSGEVRTHANVKERTDALALGLQTCLFQEHSCTTMLSSSNITTDSYATGPVVSLISTNDIDYGTCVWASHKLGCTVAPSNSGSTVDELTHQLRLCNATAIIAHPTTLVKVMEAIHIVGISAKRIFILARGHVEHLDEQIKVYVYVNYFILTQHMADRLQYICSFVTRTLQI
jgi:acyl-CoA synthetase (AMP-forming)/AMP-acid ligase II